MSIGTELYKGGPGDIFLAYLLCGCKMACLTKYLPEMATHMPSTRGFVRTAGKRVDEAFGFMAGWTSFVYESIRSDIV